MPYTSQRTQRDRTSAGAWILPLLAAILAFAISAPARADQPKTSPDGMWTLLDAAPADVLAGMPWVRPVQGQVIALNGPALDTALKLVPMEDTIHVCLSPTIITLPRPDGVLERFAFVESPIMEPALQAKYPQIRTYMGQGIDNPGASVRFDRTPQGFHAQVMRPSPDGSAERGEWFIDPLTRTDTTHYTSYWRGALASPGPWSCTTPEGPITPQNHFGPRGPGTTVTLRTYRLAVAATGEFTAFASAPASPNVVAGLASVITTVNRVNQLYQLDLAVRLVLVSNDDLVIFTNAATDPYFPPGGIPLMQCQNGATLDAILGHDNFDLGHLFNWGGGGGNAAGVGTTCNDSTPNGAGCSAIKSQGFTASSAPTGTYFWIDYVAHEMGHQLGAHHSWNGTQGGCTPDQYDPPSAYEPGSGITIMGYAGICGSDDLATAAPPTGAKVPMFNFQSIQQVTNYTSGLGCGTGTDSGNHFPGAVTSGGPFVVPTNTPFRLFATAANVDYGEVTSISWEQRDLGPGLPLGPDTENHEPLFRDFMHTNSTERIFPQLSTVLGGPAITGENPILYTRSSQFRVVVRDNNIEAGGVSFGDVAIQFAQVSANGFKVTAPAAGAEYCAGQAAVVTWDVAFTNQFPFNCPTVDITLSLDGGQTWPISLAGDYPNNGVALLTLPGIATTHARIKVEPPNNIFFSINPANFSIITGPPTVATQPVGIAQCAGNAATLFVAAGTEQPARLQWRKDGVNIPGATGQYLPFILQNSDSGDYDCVLTNACGSVTSATARVQVGVTFNGPLVAPAALPCHGLLLAVGARGVGPLSYVWKRNGVAIAPTPHYSGVNGPALIINGVQYDDEDSYSCDVTDSCETRSTNSARVALPTPQWVRRSATGLLSRGAQTQYMAYDAARHVSVYYGGYGDMLYHDTWEWDGYDWTQRFPAHNPGGRAGHRMVFDSNRNQVLLIGGSGTVPANNEVWAYDGNDWTLLSPTSADGPPVSYSLIQEYAFFDSARQKAVLITSIPPNNSFLQCATWEFDSATLTWSAGPSGNIGFAFAGTAFTYDPVRHFAVGQSWPSYPYDPSMAQTWSRTDGAWTNLGITAPPNFSSIMAFDTTRRLSVLYGSNRGTYPGVPTDTWGFDGSTWRQLLPNLNAADPLEPTELVYDSARRAMVMVGVTYFESFDTVPMETWEYRYLDHVVIDRQPRATPVVLGQPAALSVYAAGAGTLGYQWRRNGVNLNDGPGPGGSTIAGSHSPALAINLFSASNDGDYDCVISNLCGNLTSSIAHLGSVGDFNGDGQSTVADIFDFLSAWFAGDPRANADGINGLTVADIFVFLSAWFAGN